MHAYLSMYLSIWLHVALFHPLLLLINQGLYPDQMEAEELGNGKVGGSFHVVAKKMKEETSVSPEVATQVMGFILWTHIWIYFHVHLECFEAAG